MRDQIQPPDNAAADSAGGLSGAQSLLATLLACGVAPSDVAAALEKRKGVSGHDEKAARG